MGTGLIVPSYGSRSLADVVPAIATALGRGILGSPTGLELPPAPAYVIFLIDGLGAEQLQAHADIAPYLSSLQTNDPGTAAAPSTTAVSLTSLGTALPPGTHGVVGYTSRIPGTASLLNALKWPRDIDPEQWQSHPTTFSRLARDGVPVTVVNKRDFATSGLTRAAHRGARFVGADRSYERLEGVLDAADHGGLVYLYDGDLDKTGHQHGVASKEWRDQLRRIDREATELREELPPEVRLLVVSDHGMIDSPAAARLDIDAQPHLRDGVVLLGGEARFRHLYCRSGATEDVVAAWSEWLGDRAEIRTRDAAAEWFGPIDPAIAPRIGDVVVAARESYALMSPRDFPVEASLVGMHGSLTPAEMLIPLLVG